MFTRTDFLDKLNDLKTDLLNENNDSFANILNEIDSLINYYSNEKNDPATLIPKLNEVLNDYGTALNNVLGAFYTNIYTDSEVTIH